MTESCYKIKTHQVAAPCNQVRGEVCSACQYLFLSCFTIFRISLTAWKPVQFQSSIGSANLSALGSAGSMELRFTVMFVISRLQSPSFYDSSVRLFLTAQKRCVGIA